MLLIGTLMKWIRVELKLYETEASQDGWIKAVISFSYHCTTDNKMTKNTLQTPPCAAPQTVCPVSVVFVFYNNIG